jgi:hypothetical protein
LPAADVAACVSLAFTLAYFLLQFCATYRASKQIIGTASSTRVSRLLQAARVLVLLLGIMCWLAAACTLQYFTVRANQAGLAHAPQRAAVLACCWASLGLFLLLTAGELLPPALAHLTANSTLSLQQQQQQCLPHLQELQLGPPVHHASSAAARPGYMSAPGYFSAAAAAPAYGRQQQQQQLNIVLGIPCAHAAPVGSAHSMPQLPLTGEGPGARQAALMMQGAGSFAAVGSQAVRLPSLQPPPLAAWGGAAGGQTVTGTRGVAGRVLVVNRNF